MKILPCSLMTLLNHKYLKISRCIMMRIKIKMHLCTIFWMYFSWWLRQMYSVCLIGHSLFWLAWGSNSIACKPEWLLCTSICKNLLSFAPVFCKSFHRNIDNQYFFPTLPEWLSCPLMSCGARPTFCTCTIYRPYNLSLSPNCHTGAFSSKIKASSDTHHE